MCRSAGSRHGGRPPACLDLPIEPGRAKSDPLVGRTPMSDKRETPVGDKPAILKSAEFTVEEGLGYRVFRTGAIWMNKLFFSSVFLLVVWLAIASFNEDVACVDSFKAVDNGTADGDVPQDECTVWLTPTAKYLGAMSVLSFLASLAFGALGLMVGKKILEATPVAEEVGARREGETDESQQPKPPQ